MIKVNFISKSLVYSIASSLVLLVSAQAAIIQNFNANNYFNPAELQRINIAEILAGAFINNPQVSFSGTSTGGSGEANSNETDVLPFYRGAYRLNDRFVIGLNVSIPYYAHIEFPQSSVVAADATRTLVKDTDFAFQGSAKITDKLSLGAGFNVNNMHDFQVNFVGPGGVNIVNKAKALSYGWDIGVTYDINQFNLIGLAYYSRLTPTFKGYSSGLGYFGNLTISGMNLPDTYKATYTHILSQNWLFALGASYSRWQSAKTVVFNNVATIGQIRLPVNYYSTWSFDAMGRYQFDPKWAALAVAVYDQGGAHQYARTVSFPSAPAWLLKAGVSCQITKEAALQAIPGIVYSNANIDKPFTSRAVGKMRIRVYSLDLRFVYKL